MKLVKGTVMLPDCGTKRVMQTGLASRALLFATITLITVASAPAWGTLIGNPPHAPIITYHVKGDYDGDGKTDLVVYDSSNGNWFIHQSSNGQTVTIPWGWNGAVLVPGDYDGDGKTDVAVFDPNTGNWFIRLSSTSQMMTGKAIPFGWNGAVPVPGDYDGDGKTDLAVFDPNTGNWFIHYSSTSNTVEIPFGWKGASPVPGDYDGDGKTDLAVFDPNTGNWFIRQSSTGKTVAIAFGWKGALPVPGDYDGDGKTDLAVFDPNTGNWFIHQSSNGQTVTIPWGWNGAVPVTGDYDGDGKMDVSVYDPNNMNWFIRQSSNGQTWSGGAFAYGWRGATVVSGNGPGSLPVITSSSPLPNGVVGVPYYDVLQAIGGETLGTSTHGYTWALASGSTPPWGLSVCPLGTAAVQGTPTHAGTYTFQLTVADLTGRYTTKTFTLEIDLRITVSASPSSGGTVSGGGIYAKNSTVTVSATPNSGYKFTNWTENGTVVSSSASYTFTAGDQNRSLVANFVPSGDPWSGTWSGPYSYSFVGTLGFTFASSGTMTMTITWDSQSDTYSGSCTLSSVNWITWDTTTGEELSSDYIPYSGDCYGSTSGNTISGSSDGSTSQGSWSFSFTGNSNGTTISGPMAAAGHPNSGTITLTRQ